MHVMTGGGCDLVEASEQMLTWRHTAESLLTQLRANRQSAAVLLAVRCDDALLLLTADAPHKRVQFKSKSSGAILLSQDESLCLFSVPEAHAKSYMEHRFRISGSSIYFTGSDRRFSCKRARTYIIIIFIIQVSSQTLHNTVQWFSRRVTTCYNRWKPKFASSTKCCVCASPQRNPSNVSAVSRMILRGWGS